MDRMSHIGFVGNVGFYNGTRGRAHVAPRKRNAVAPQMISVTGDRAQVPMRQINKEDFGGVIRAAESAKDVVVLKFSASFCQSCKNMEPKFKKLAKAYRNFTYFEVNYEKNKELCEELGVDKLPHFQVFDGRTKKSEGLSCTWTEAGKLRDLLDRFNI